MTAKSEKCSAFVCHARLLSSGNTYCRLIVYLTLRLLHSFSLFFLLSLIIQNLYCVLYEKQQHIFPTQTANVTYYVLTLCDTSSSQHLHQHTPNSGVIVVLSNISKTRRLSSMYIFDVRPKLLLFIMLSPHSLQCVKVWDGEIH